MFQHLIYKCPKCKNTLLVSNKMLHDLRCTEENPATYENILRQSQVREVQEESPYNSSSQFSSGVRRSNNDGTSSEIKKNINIKGEEFPKIIIIKKYLNFMNMKMIIMIM